MPGREQVTTVEADASPLSRAGTVAGTIGYMSPEQARGAAVDARKDIFSFGALPYELVTGRRACLAAEPAPRTSAIDAPASDVLINTMKPRILFWSVTSVLAGSCSGSTRW